MEINLYGTIVTFWLEANQSFGKTALGLKYVHQLFNNLDFKSFQEVKEEYNLTELRYNSLKKAIPLEWKDFFCQKEKVTFMPLQPHNYDICKYTKGLAGKVYKYLVGDVCLIHNKLMKWEKEIGEELTDGIWDYGLAHLNVYKLTNITKYRDFQYRLLQRGLVTNIQLCRWGIKPSELCSFCGQERETIEHLMCGCELVKDFWNEIGRYIKDTYNVQIQLSMKNVILNSIAPKKYKVVNFLCLVTKQYIYRCRCQQKNLHMSLWRNHVKQVECIEKYIAVKNDKLGIHNRKWLIVQSDDASCTSLQHYIADYIHEI